MRLHEYPPSDDVTSPPDLPPEHEQAIRDAGIDSTDWSTWTDSEWSAYFNALEQISVDNGGTTTHADNLHSTGTTTFTDDDDNTAELTAVFDPATKTWVLTTNIDGTEQTQTVDLSDGGFASVPAVDKTLIFTADGNVYEVPSDTVDVDALSSSPDTTGNVSGRYAWTPMTDEDGDGVYTASSRNWGEDDRHGVSRRREISWDEESNSISFKTYRWGYGLTGNSGAHQSVDTDAPNEIPFNYQFYDNGLTGVDSYDGRHPANERWIEWPPGSGNEIPVSYGIEVVKNHMEDIDDKISDLTSINQIAMIRLQQYINNMNMLVTLLSNLLSNKKDTENTIVRNI